MISRRSKVKCRDRSTRRNNSANQSEDETNKRNARGTVSSAFDFAESDDEQFDVKSSKRSFRTRRNKDPQSKIKNEQSQKTVEKKTSRRAEKREGKIKEDGKEMYIRMRPKKGLEVSACDNDSNGRQCTSTIKKQDKSNCSEDVSSRLMFLPKTKENRKEIGIGDSRCRKKTEDENIEKISFVNPLPEVTKTCSNVKSSKLRNDKTTKKPVLTGHVGDNENAHHNGCHKDENIKQNYLKNTGSKTCPICQKKFSDCQTDDEINHHVNVCLDSTKEAKQGELQRERLTDNHLSSKGEARDEDIARIIQSREEEKLAEEQSMENFFVCAICQKDLNRLSASSRQIHINKCADVVEKENANVRKAERKSLQENKEFDCIICGLRFSTMQQRISHMKQCSKQNKVDRRELLTLVKETAANATAIMKQKEDLPVRTVNDLLHNSASSSSKPAHARNQTGKRKKNSSRKCRDEEIPVILTRSEEEARAAAIARATKIIEEQIKFHNGANLEKKCNLTGSLLASKYQKRKKDSERLLLGKDNQAPSRSTSEMQVDGCSLEETSGPRTRLWDLADSKTSLQEISRFYVSDIFEEEFNQTREKLSRKDKIETSQNEDHIVQKETDVENEASPVFSKRDPETAQEISNASVADVTKTILNESFTMTQLEKTAILDNLGTVVKDDKLDKGMSVENEKEHLDGECDGFISNEISENENQKQVEKLQKLKGKSEEALISSLELLLKDESLKDLEILCCGGKKVKAHSCIVFARCPQLYTNGKEVDLSDYSEEAVNFFLQHLYTGDVKICKKLAAEVFELAKSYTMGLLGEACLLFRDDDIELQDVLMDDQPPIETSYVDDAIKGLFDGDDDDSIDGGRQGQDMGDSPFNESDEEDLREFFVTQRERKGSAHDEDEDHFEAESSSEDTCRDDEPMAEEKNNLKEETIEENGSTGYLGDSTEVFCRIEKTFVEAIIVNDLNEEKKMSVGSEISCPSDDAKLSASPLLDTSCELPPQRRISNSPLQGRVSESPLQGRCSKCPSQNSVSTSQLKDRSGKPSSQIKKNEGLAEHIQLIYSSDEDIIKEQDMEEKQDECRDSKNDEMKSSEEAETNKLNIVDFNKREYEEEEVFFNNSSGGLDMAICLQETSTVEKLETSNAEKENAELDHHKLDICLMTPDKDTPEPFLIACDTPLLFSARKCNEWPSETKFGKFEPSKSVSEHEEGKKWEGEAQNQFVDLNDDCIEEEDSHNSDISFCGNVSKYSQDRVFVSEPVSPCVTTSQFERKRKTDASDILEENPKPQINSYPVLSQKTIINVDEDNAGNDVALSENDGFHIIDECIEDDGELAKEAIDCIFAGNTFKNMNCDLIDKTPQTKNDCNPVVNDSKMQKDIHFCFDALLTKQSGRLMNKKAMEVIENSDGSSSDDVIDTTPPKEGDLSKNGNRRTFISESKSQDKSTSQLTSSDAFDVDRKQNISQRRKRQPSSSDSEKDSSSGKQKRTPQKYLNKKGKEWSSPPKKTQKVENEKFKNMLKSISGRRKAQRMSDEGTSNSDLDSCDSNNYADNVASISSQKLLSKVISLRSHQEEYEECPESFTVLSSFSKLSSSADKSIDACLVPSNKSSMNSFCDDGGYNPDIHNELFQDDASLEYDNENCLTESLCCSSDQYRTGELLDRSRKPVVCQSAKRDTQKLEGDNDYRTERPDDSEEFDCFVDDGGFNCDIADDFNAASATNVRPSSERNSFGKQEKIASSQKPHTSSSLRDTVSKKKKQDPSSHQDDVLVDKERATLEDTFGLKCSGEEKDLSILFSNIENPCILEDQDEYENHNNKSQESNTPRESKQGRLLQKEHSLGSISTPEQLRFGTVKTPSTAVRNFRPGCKVHPETGSAITPMSDYEALLTPELTKRVKTHGMRKLPKHMMAGKLREIYKLRHGFSQWEEPPAKAKRKGKARKKAKETEQENVDKADDRNDVLIESCNRPSTEDSQSSGDEGQKTFEAGICSDDEKNSESSQTDQIEGTTFEKLTRFIKSQKDLYHKVLTYQIIKSKQDMILKPKGKYYINYSSCERQKMEQNNAPEMRDVKLNFEEIYESLKEAKLKCSKARLMDFLDVQCSPLTRDCPSNGPQISFVDNAICEYL